MILHISDDEKFIDNAIELFETVNPKKNLFLINHDLKDSPLKFIKSKEVTIYPFGSKEYSKVLLNNFDSIIFHNLYLDYKLEILNKLDINDNIHWMCWGADLYNIPQLSSAQYLPLTKKLINNQKTLKQIFVDKFEELSPGIYNKYYQARFNSMSSFFKFKNLTEKIKSVSTVVDSEFNLIKKYLNPKISYIPFRYGSLNQFCKGINSSEFCDGENILIGNSASYTNNHLDAFDFIKKNNLGKIYAPLSYGDNNYAEIIKKNGYEKFGVHFCPISDFLELSEYNKILKNCNNVIINSMRQQAVGNIIVSLWLGAKVFLQKENPVFKSFERNGIRLFDIEKFNKIKNESINNEFIFQNRYYLSMLYSQESIYKTTDKLVSKLLA